MSITKAAVGHDDAAVPRQSLGRGPAGTALLYIERALSGLEPWQSAHTWIRQAVSEPISSADTAGLYYGAPAVTFMLDAAATAGHYGDVLTRLDHAVTTLAHRRVDAALSRIAAGRLATFREYDTILGLAGVGAVLLRRDPRGSAMERVLQYLVALSRPVRVSGERLPGWWVGHGPYRRTSDTYPHGHAGLGVAHGISGPLALMSLAVRHGLTVAGQTEAIADLCDQLDTWRQDDQAGAWWPQWITPVALRSRRPDQTSPARPSWCYGTPGIARAGQLASIAIADRTRRNLYEAALVSCLRDDRQQRLLTDPGLCHGTAGQFQTMWRAARDAATPAIADCLPKLAESLGHQDPPDDPGLLDGNAGTALAMNTAIHNAVPASGWDSCLLIN